MVSTNHNCNEGEAEGRSSFNILTSQGAFLPKPSLLILLSMSARSCQLGDLEGSAKEKRVLLSKCVRRIENVKLTTGFQFLPLSSHLNLFQKTQHVSSGTRESVHEEVVIFFQQQFKLKDILTRVN